MTSEIEARILRILDLLAADADCLETDARDFGRQILTHLSRINSTLSAIDRNLTLLKMKK